MCVLSDWHDGTRKTLGWVYLRFRPERWYFEFVYMARKVAVLTTTTYLGSVGSGHIAWGVIFMITVAACFGQWFMTPFPEDRAARYSSTPCPCCSDLCSPHHGPFKPLVRALMAYLNPSLNDLELGGLTCQLVSLASNPHHNLASREISKRVLAVAGDAVLRFGLPDVW